MKLHAAPFGTMGLLCALAGVGLRVEARSLGDALPARVTLGTPKEQATFGVGYDSKEKATFEPHRPFVTSVVFSPDGKTLVSSSGDTTVKLWSVSAAKESGAADNDTKEAAIRKDKKNLIGNWATIN